MDYDENEFHAKDLHLAGEGTNKIPVIPSYAIPKYDFDDSLQGSLRFDTLESDTFLGIGSNEDSHWIEEYSRGDSGIHFGADTSKSCSITRQSNVWSEATSSESVEMLLKSVVQEDILRLQSENKVSDSCDELGCMIKQMESNSKRNSASSYACNVAQSSLAVHILPREDVGSKDSEHANDSGIVSGGELDDVGGLRSIQPAITVDTNINPGYVVRNESIDDTGVSTQLRESEPENKSSVSRESDELAESLNRNKEIVNAGGVRLDNQLGKEASSHIFMLNKISEVQVLPEISTGVSVGVKTSQKKNEIVTPEDKSFIGVNEKLTEFYSVADKSDISGHTGFSNEIDINPAYAYNPTSSIKIEMVDKSNCVERKGIDDNDTYSISKGIQAQALSNRISPDYVPPDADNAADVPDEIKSDFAPVLSTEVGEKLSSALTDVENYEAGEKTEAKEDLDSAERSNSSEVPKQSFKPSEVYPDVGEASEKAKVKSQDEGHMSSKENEQTIDLAEDAKNVGVSEAYNAEIGVALNSGGIGENENKPVDDSAQIPATDASNEKEHCPNPFEIVPCVECRESGNVSDNGNANSSAHSVPLSLCNDVEQVEPSSNVGALPFRCETEEKALVEEQVSFLPILSSSKLLEEQSPLSELKHVEDQPQVMLRRNVKLVGNSERKSRRSFSKVPKKETAKKSNSSKDTGSRLGSTEKTQHISSNVAESSPQLPQSAGVFQQPFTDLQQVQLRAQIFVYGSLIQGIAPDESYMISAFGGPDGGKNLWDNSWRLCYQRSKLLLSAPETPLSSRAGSRPSDLMTKDLKLSSTSQPIIKSAPFLTPMLPFSSPLWTPDPLQSSGVPKTPAELHRPWSPLPSQITHTRNMNSPNPSWLAQSPLCGPWVASPSTSVLDASARLLSSKLAYEASHIHHGIDSSPLVPPASKQITPVPASLMEFSSTIVAEACAPKDATNLAPCSQPSAETKSRKRKKNVPEPSVQRRKESGNLLPMPVVPSISPECNAEKPSLPISTPLLKPNHVEEKKTLLAEDVLDKVKESKAYAEEAASIATAAVNHSQELQSVIEKQKTLCFSPDNEFIIASAVGAITAAASVAKAAAAAASLASNAALQAKLIAEEAMVKSSPIVFSSVFNDAVTKASPASILKADNSSISILGAARETTRRRVEAASAASKRAENMDAIVKAAELAAEAVSQAGKIVAMGDHLPISELISTSMKSPVTEKKTLDSDNNLVEDNARLIDVIASKSYASKEKGRKLSDFLGAPQAEVENGDNNSIKEGSLVEVYKEGGGLKGAWFCGNVVGLNDGKALVCYSDLMLGEEKLKEWVELRTKGHKPPKIRLSRPISAFPLGTRKRRRSAHFDKKWIIGDRVDAWIRDCWSEGVISEKKSQGDDCIYSVHFPASGETGEVKSWDLRPTLTWKEGQWSEKISLPSKGDSPIEKKARFDLEKPVESEPTLSQLTASERIFNIGKGSTGPLRMTRTGSQKEGSNVVFGVPKPGKKRKFIEVSKHYVASQASKPPPTRGTKHILKPSLLPKPKPPKHPTAFGRSTADLTSKRHVDGDFVFSSQLKESSGRPKGSGSSSVEETGGSSNAAEPRRSNRRIQPTSRLLEGLQTSLTVSKLPSAAYDKNGKSKSKYEK